MLNKIVYFYQSNILRFTLLQRYSQRCGGGAGWLGWGNLPPPQEFSGMYTGWKKLYILEKFVALANVVKLMDCFDLFPYELGKDFGKSLHFIIY